LLAFEHGDLLAEGEDLEGGIASGTEENAECTQHSDEELHHELRVVTQRGARLIGQLGVFPTH
jgi:hypothetical protein